MARILLTNDDGVDEESIRVLYKVLSQEHNVTVVAPAVQQSGAGKSVSAHKDIQLKRLSDNVFSLYSTPADCVQVGIYEVLGTKPDLVVSGINLGTNIGHGRNLSSGTVGAAVEAALDGVPAIASSIARPDGTTFNDPAGAAGDYQQAALLTSRVVDVWLEHHNKDLFNSIELLSLNMPENVKANDEIVATTIHRHPIGQRFSRVSDTHVRLTSFPIDEENAPEGTDVHALTHGKVSLTPINLELVDENHRLEIQKLF